MLRNRQAPPYTGCHRRSTAASGQHRQDPLPPPDMPPPLSAPVLLSNESEGRWSEWYDPRRLRSIDPEIIAPTQQVPEKPGPEPPWQPQRKIRARYITAAVATALVAVPALIMAGWIARDNSATTDQSQLAPETARIPIMLNVQGKPYSVCITLSGAGRTWKASASDAQC